MKKKICFVVQRYGTQILGGSESYCRQIAERLVDYYDVDVVTTKCIDYISWANELDADEESIRGINVIRFPTLCERYLGPDEMTKALSPEAAVEDGIEWLKAQGPYCPGLIEYVKSQKDVYDVFVLMTYLYYPTVLSSYEVGKKSILVPTAHDEEFIYQPVMKELFENVAGLYFLTPEEQLFVEGLFSITGKICNAGGRSGGIGIKIPSDVDPQSFRQKYSLGEDPYVVYAGRIDNHKGFPLLFSYFDDYKIHTETHRNLKLVLMGSSVLEIPDRNDILNVGFLSEEDKINAMAGAVALINPSKNESLSIILLEAMSVGTPVLVNGKCEVLKGHCLRSNAGLYFENHLEFIAELDFLLDNEQHRIRMGRNAVDYVRKYYQWETILGGLCDVIDRVAAKCEVNGESPSIVDCTSE